MDKAPGILWAAVAGLCPRCGGRGIFKGLIAVNFRCRACGLALTQYDIGGGPALAVVIALALLILGAAIWVEWHYAPDDWFHALVWPSLLTGLAIAIIRPLKAGLIAIGHAYHTGKMKL